MAKLGAVQDVSPTGDSHKHDRAVQDVSSAFMFEGGPVTTGEGEPSAEEQDACASIHGACPLYTKQLVHYPIKKGLSSNLLPTICLMWSTREEAGRTGALYVKRVMYECAGNWLYY